MQRSDLSHPQPRTESHTKAWKWSYFLLCPKWPAVVQSLTSCTLPGSQNKLEIERQGGKKKQGHSPVPALPLHRICNKADGHMGDATFFEESEVDSWPSPLTHPHPPTLAPSPSLTNCTLECQTSSLSGKYTVCQLMGHWREETSRVLNLWTYTCVCVCVSLLQLASCPVSNEPFYHSGRQPDKQPNKNQYSFAWLWPTYRKANGCFSEPICEYGEICWHVCLAGMYKFAYIHV